MDKEEPIFADSPAPASPDPSNQAAKQCPPRKKIRSSAGLLAMACLQESEPPQLANIASGSNETMFPANGVTAPEGHTEKTTAQLVHLQHNLSTYSLNLCKRWNTS